MTPTVGIFFDRASAERAVGNLRAVGVPPRSIHVLVPGGEPLAAQVSVSEAEQPGMGRAIGGVLGGAVGVASGAELGAAAAASALLPIAAPAIAIGIVGAVILSLGGVAVTPADADERDRAVAVLEGSGAESVDAARERWWIGLREGEAFEYRAEGLDFQRDEALFREGFEAAQSASAGERSERETEAFLKERYPASYQNPAFLRGYLRGRAHYR